jgi:DNA-binding MarR family transcriptional regulator
MFVNSVYVFSEVILGPIDADIVAAELSRLFPLLQQKLIRPFEHLARSRVSALQFQVLYLLEEAGPLSMSLLSQRLQVSKQQMTPVISKLDMLGFVSRQKDVSDARMLRVILSPEGAQFLEDQRSEVVDMLRHKVSALGPEDMLSLYDVICGMRRLISKIP